MHNHAPRWKPRLVFTPTAAECRSVRTAPRSAATRPVPTIPGEPRRTERLGLVVWAR